jgi:hypothetical protein
MARAETTDESAHQSAPRSPVRTSGRGGPAVPLRRPPLSNVALTVILLLGGRWSVSSWDDPWGGAAWRPDQGGGYDTGYGGSGEGTYDSDGRRLVSPVGAPSGFQEPSRASWDSPSPGAGVAGYGDYDQPNAWGRGGSAGSPRQLLPGDYPGLGPDRSSSLGPSGQGAPDYPPDLLDPRYPSRGLPAAVPLAPGQMRAVPGPGYLDPPRETYPGYRFRGDPPGQLGHWQSAPYDTGYRFRPLTEQERGRLGQVPEYRGRPHPQGSGGFRHSRASRGSSPRPPMDSSPIHGGLAEAFRLAPDSPASLGWRSMMRLGRAAPNGGAGRGFTYTTTEDQDS